MRQRAPGYLLDTSTSFNYRSFSPPVKRFPSSLANPATSFTPSTASLGTVLQSVVRTAWKSVSKSWFQRALISDERDDETMRSDAGRMAWNGDGLSIDGSDSWREVYESLK